MARFRVFFIFLSVCTVLPAHAEDLAVRVRLEDPCPCVEERGAAHLFGGRTVDLAIAVSTASPRRIDLQARLVQVGSDLAAPLGGAVAIAEGAEANPMERILSVRLPLPKVRRAADFEVRFFSRASGGADWSSAGSVSLRLYPVELLEPLRAIAAGRSLFVLDAEGGLRRFLEGTGVPFADAASVRATPGDAVALWVQDAPPSSPSARRATLEKLFRVAGTVVVFAEAPSDAPDRQLIRSAQRTRADLPRSLVASLATDPRSQLALVETVQLALSEDSILLEGGTP